MKKILNLIMLFSLCFTSLSVASCQKSDDGGSESSSDAIEFVFKTALSNYYGVVDNSNKTITVGGISSSNDIKSVSYTLPEGYTISPEPSEVSKWYKEQAFEIGKSGESSQTYTVILSDMLETVESKYVVMGYIMLSGTDFESVFETIDLTKVTHTLISFASVNSDGSITTTSIDTYVDMVVKAAHDAGGRALLAVNKASDGEFTACIKASDTRTKLIENLIDYCEEKGFDGIDLDYEDYNSFDLTSLIAFAKELRETMPEEWQLTCAIGPWLQYTGYAEYFDYINVMSYGEMSDGDSPGYHATMTKFQSDIANTLVWALDKSKIVGGVPFYGWSWENSPSVFSIKYEYVINKYPTAEVADADNYGSLYYNGRNTIREKCVYVKDQGYGGIMIWQLAQDCLNEDFRLLDVIGEEMFEE
ncbi:MAG: glycosyl hydrolase family 18 protein [Rikenellaceae bacterium]